MQGGASDIEEISKGVPSTQPCLLVQGQHWYLVFEKQILFQIQEIEKAVAVLFATFFVLNTHYPAGCDNFYTLLELFFLNKALKTRKATINSVITLLNQF